MIVAKRVDHWKKAFFLGLGVKSLHHSASLVKQLNLVKVIVYYGVRGCKFFQDNYEGFFVRKKRTLASKYFGSLGGSDEK